MQNHPADQEPRRVLGSFFAPKSQNTPTWEQRKLVELTKTITTGKSVNSDEGEVSDGDIGVLKTSCVSYDRFNPSESKPVVKSEQQLVKCAVEKDSVIVSRMNTPERVGACGYVSTDFPNLFLPDRLWKLKFQDTVDTYFVYMMLVSSAYKEKITSMASGTSGSMYNIPKETFLNLQLVIPAKIDEQKQLGKILKKIDTLITLHQRKYEKLVNIKKSMLDKMFPKNGASVPEIRFKGFTDLWEQRKLGEMVDVCSGMDYKHLSEGDIPVYGTGGYMLSVNKALSYDRNAVGIGRKGTIDKPYILKAPFWTVDTLFYAIPKDSKNIDFTFDVFQKVDWKKKDESTGVPSLSKIAINETSISTPSKLEQERIGSLFRNLDTLITLHQRKLEKLQNIKKSCLEKMFV